MATKEKTEKTPSVADVALKTANEAAAEVRKLKTQLENEGVITNAHANARGGDLLRAKKAAQGGSVRVAMLIVVLFAAVAFGANALVWKIGDAAYVDEEGDATFNSVTADVTGDVTGDVAGAITMTVTAANWTDGSTNSLVPGINLISGTGGANDTTNTVVLSNPSAAGDVAIIVIAATSTNLITIADSGNVAASGAILLDANDSAILVAPTASLWVETPGDN